MKCCYSGWGLRGINSQHVTFQCFTAGMWCHQFRVIDWFVWLFALICWRIIFEIRIVVRAPRRTTLFMLFKNFWWTLVSSGFHGPEWVALFAFGRGICDVHVPEIHLWCNSLGESFWWPCIACQSLFPTCVFQQRKDAGCQTWRPPGIAV